VSDVEYEERIAVPLDGGTSAGVEGGRVTARELKKQTGGQTILRVQIKDEHGEYVGWFDRSAATKIASYTHGDPCVEGYVLYKTKDGRLVVNSWSSSGRDVYRAPLDDHEVSEILVRGGYDGSHKDMLDLLAAYEERIAIKMDSGIPEDEAVRQTREEMGDE
jgi:hypothetical protein